MNTGTPTASRPGNRTPAIVAVLGVLAVAIGVTAGLVITSGADDSELDTTTASESEQTNDAGGPPSDAPSDVPSDTLVEVSSRPAPTRSVLGNPVPDNLRAIANRYSNALANENWAVARSMNAALAGKSDDEFQADWGDVGTQFVVPVRTEGPGVLRLGLIVHQLYDIDTGGGGARTSLFCNTWTIDATRGTLSAATGFRPDFDTYPANTDPAELEDEILNNC